MFTYIKVKNFKSLKEVNFNLKKNENTINKFIALYGENGCGKTNVVEVFKFIKENIFSRATDVRIANMIRLDKENEDEEPENISNKSRRINMFFSLNKYRTIDEKEPTEVEFGFEIEGKQGVYNIVFNDRVIEEKLYYIVNKQKSNHFSIKYIENGEIEIGLNENVFLNPKYNEELREEIKKYWGRYSFLSIVYFETTSKNREYIEENINKNLRNVIITLLQTNINIMDGTRSLQFNYYNNKVKIYFIEEGRIRKHKEPILDRYEEILNMFFVQAYADIKRVKYIRTEDQTGIAYKLFFEKIIGGEVKEIPYNLESAGTKRILEKIGLILGTLNGEVAIVDEIDNGIHDVLMKNIIMNIIDEITGQLIITTHNTLLLEVLPKYNIYFMDVDHKGNKAINCVTDYDFKLQKNHNARELYFKGIFGGIPMSDYIDFETIKYLYEEMIERPGDMIGED